MKDRRKTTSSKAGKHSAAVGHDVSKSTVVTGDHNVVNVSTSVEPVAPALHQPRAPVGDFVGREREIETLVTALRHGSRASISGINGMGGIGKTELALLVAERLTADYPDARLFINLQGTDPNPRSPEQVMEICLRAFLGPEARLPEDLDQLSNLYRNQLTGKRVLLLLDNALDSAQVRPLLPPAGSALLVTSRQTITLPGMTPLALYPLSVTEARKLLTDIVRHAAPAADQICHLCGYLPLAIRAAGSLLAITPDLEPVDYAQQLSDERNRLEIIGTEGVDIDVAASFNLSYARLTPEAARVFRLLSVFPGTFNAAAEQDVCSDKDHAHLSDLVRRSLVLYDAGTKRYRFHDLVRLFAATKLSAAESSDGLEGHAAYYKNVLASTNRLYLNGGDALARGLALFDLEWSNIQAGHDWVATQEFKNDEDLSRLAMAYSDVGSFVLHLRLHSREWIRWLEIALLAAQRLKDRAGEGRALSHLGLAYSNLGDTQGAIERFEQALAIDRELGDRIGEGIDLNNLGIAYKNLGETNRAIEFYQQYLTISRMLADQRGEGNALGNLANAYLLLGDSQRAIDFHQQQLKIVRAIGDRRGEGMALGNIGVVYRKLGDLQRAIQFYEQALVIDREIGDSRSEGADLWNMSLALNGLGQRSRAITYAEQSLTILTQIEDPNATKVRAQIAAWRAEAQDD